MPKVHQIQKSPIASYLLQNKAQSIKTPDGCHFISPEGMYLGKQSKIINNNVTYCITEIFGESTKRLFYQAVCVLKNFVYLKESVNNDTATARLTPVAIKKLKHYVNFKENKSICYETNKTLKNKLRPYSVVPNSETVIYETDNKLEYQVEEIVKEEPFIQRKNYVNKDFVIN